MERKWQALPVACAAACMLPLDGTIAVVVLSAIQDGLHQLYQHPARSHALPGEFNPAFPLGSAGAAGGGR